MDDKHLGRIVVILLFALTFSIVGWAAPVIYASNVPSNQIIEVHDFDAENVSTEADSHYVCFDRTVYYDTSAKIFTELYLIDGNNRRVEVESRTSERYFQHGRSTVVSRFTLPEHLSVGKYRYILVVRMNMADGRVTRDLVFESQPFHVKKPSNIEMTENASC